MTSTLRCHPERHDNVILSGTAYVILSSSAYVILSAAKDLSPAIDEKILRRSAPQNDNGVEIVLIWRDMVTQYQRIT